MSTEQTDWGNPQLSVAEVFNAVQTVAKIKPGIQMIPCIVVDDFIIVAKDRTALDLEIDIEKLKRYQTAKNKFAKWLAKTGISYRRCAEFMGYGDNQNIVYRLAVRADNPVQQIRNFIKRLTGGYVTEDDWPNEPRY